MEVFGRYFDGVRPVAQDVRLRRVAQGVEIVLPDGRQPVLWLYGEARIDEIGVEAHLHRVREDLDTGERLIVDGVAFRDVFGSGMTQFGRGRAGEASRRRVLFWSLAAVASLLFLYFVGLAAFARVAAPLVPWRWEAALGQNVEPQVLEIFSKGKPARTCGIESGPGKAALEAMVVKLAAGAALPGPLRVNVLDVSVTNAFALPGGRIFLFRSVIEKAEDPDEVAGVLAHEIGHVVHRDSMRALIHNGALSLIVSAVLGDFTGSSAIAILSNMMISSAYSRENESEADKVSVDLMRHAGADPRAINRFFKRLADVQPGNRTIFDAFRSHPITADRMADVEKLAGASAATKPVLDAAQWRALKAICSESKSGG